MVIPKLVHDTELIDLLTLWKETRTHTRTPKQPDLLLCALVKYYVLYGSFLANLNKDTDFVVVVGSRFLLPFHFSVTSSAATATARLSVSSRFVFVGVNVTFVVLVCTPHWELL